MESKERIIVKIRALLGKTTDNGASENEAEMALKYASELMTKHFISEFDLKDPLVGKKCKMVEVPLVKSGYDLTLFYNSLTKLFDCKYFYNKKRIAFFGFEEDAELCGYFYHFITKSVFTEVEKFKKTPGYLYATKFHHGRTVVASFIKGYLLRICEKMKEMYKNKESNIPETHSLMVIAKADKVKEQFDQLNIKITASSVRDFLVNEYGFNTGSDRGSDFKLIQGIKSKQNASRKMLE